MESASSSSSNPDVVASPTIGRPSGKLFVGGLHPETTEEVMRAYFSKFGEIASLTLKRHHNGSPRCFGFVQFVDPAAAQKTLDHAEFHEILGKPAQVKPAIPETELRRHGAFGGAVTNYNSNSSKNSLFFSGGGAAGLYNLPWVPAALAIYSSYDCRSSAVLPPPPPPSFDNNIYYYYCMRL